MKAFFTLLSFLFSSFVFANNIQLQKVALTDTNRAAQTVNIKMNLSWEHSWRDSINWDAAWIIVKYKEARDSMWKWKHVQLVQSGNNTGSAAGVKMVVPDDGTGAFFYRSQIGSGNISSENVKLLWNYGAAGVTNIDSVEVRVFATEMVYVPEGAFCLGDGNGNQRSEYSFQLKNAPNNYAVINGKWSPLITAATNEYGGIGDDQILLSTGIRISGVDGLDVNNDKIADNPHFPTGYKGFYCMKYKVTQGQYTDFLNTICVNDTNENEIANYRVTSSEGFLSTVPKHLLAAWGRSGDFIHLFFSGPDKRRHSITFDSIQYKFLVSRPDRAYGLMDLRKSLSFSEWVGLRPMSELEFEKACRGPLPPKFYEKAWGEEYSQSEAAYPLTYSGVENGTEFFSDYDITKVNSDPTGYGMSPAASRGDGGSGPYRVGIFATDTSSRISSGAGFYGIMDLNKITSELVYPLSSATSRLFSDSMHGKGVLSAFGHHYSFSSAFDEYLYYSLYRKRGVSGRGADPTQLNGFRAVRLAPSDN